MSSGHNDWSKVSKNGYIVARMNLGLFENKLSAQIERTTKQRMGHYNDVIMGTIASQITSLTIVYSIVYLAADQRKQQSSASLAFVRAIHRGPVNSPHKWPVTRKMFPFDDVIMGPFHDDQSQILSLSMDPESNVFLIHRIYELGWCNIHIWLCFISVFVSPVLELGFRIKHHC